MAFTGISTPRILFITATRIGDAVLSSGLLAHLAARYPAARITVACGPLPAPLFTHMPNVVRVIALAKRRFSLHWVLLWAKTFFTFWDMVVDLRGTGLSFFLPARERHVLWGSTRLARHHRVEDVAALFSLSAPADPRLVVGATAHQRAAELIPAGPPVLAIAPTANWAGKIWPAASFIALIERLTAPDGILPAARVAVFSGPGERALAQPVLDSIPPARRIDLAGTIDLPTSYACLERAAFFVGNDSGLMHMAACAGIPTLGLFGPSEERHYAPWGPRSAVVRTDERPAALFARPDMDWKAPPSLLDGLGVDKVAAAARELYARTRPA